MIEPAIVPPETVAPTVWGSRNPLAQLSAGTVAEGAVIVPFANVLWPELSVVVKVIVSGSPDASL